MLGPEHPRGRLAAVRRGAGVHELELLPEAYRSMERDLVTREIREYLRREIPDFDVLAKAEP